jgi:hypothetical protein
LSWCTKGCRRASSNSSRLLHRLLLTLQHAGRSPRQGLPSGMLVNMLARSTHLSTRLSTSKCSLYMHSASNPICVATGRLWRLTNCP